jgi:hypothetical protein
MMNFIECHKGWVLSVMNVKKTLQYNGPVCYETDKNIIKVWAKYAICWSMMKILWASPIDAIHDVLDRHVSCSASNEKRGNLKTHGAKNKDLQWKNRQPQNAWGSEQRPLTKKPVTPEYKGIKSKTFNEKGGNPKMEGTQIKDLWWKMQSRTKADH